MPQSDTGFVVDPAGASSSTVSARSELPSVATLAKDLVLFSIDVVGQKGLLTSGTASTLLVIDFVLADHLFSTEYSTAASVTPQSVNS